VAFVAGWLFSLGFVVAAFALPFVSLSQSRRTSTIAVAAAFYAAASRDLLYLGDYLTAAGDSLFPAAYWLLALTIQSFVWGLLYRFPLPVTASCLVLALPLGFISWAHPWHAAGILFPSTGIFGILATTLLAEWGVRRFSLLAAAATLMLAALAFALRNEPAPPPAWAAIDTHYGDVFHHNDQLALIEEITRVSNASAARVIVWPESMVARFNDATRAFWPRIGAGKTIAFGAIHVIDDTRYRNTITFLGAEPQPNAVDQRQPVPAVIWQPLNGSGAAFTVASPVRTILGERAAFLICYEQLLASSYAPLLFLERPTLLVASSNAYWVRMTSIPAVQHACLRSWARLLGIPYLEAQNI